MTISLITVCWNSAETVGATFESVARQIPGDVPFRLEYIIIDGGSTDGTAEQVRTFAESLNAAGQNVHSIPTSCRWISERDAGIYDAFDKGIRMATGDVVGFLHSNDVFQDDRVLADIASTFMDKKTEALYGDIRFIDKEGQTTRYYSSAPWKSWMHYWGYMPAHPSIYVRRTIFERYGLYKTSYSISGDFEWMVRVFCRNGVKAHYLKRCFVAMGTGGASTTFSRKWRLNSENVRGNRENGYFCILPMMLPKYAFKILGCIRKKI